MITLSSLTLSPLSPSPSPSPPPPSSSHPLPPSPSPPSPSPPPVPPVVRVQDVTANESSPVTLLCENLRPSDAVVYSWEKEGETLPDEVFADLQLPPVSRTDAANYTCVAANSFGLTRETGQLIVQCECPGARGGVQPAVGVVGDRGGSSDYNLAKCMLYLCVVCASAKG